LFTYALKEHYLFPVAYTYAIISWKI